MRIQLRKRRSKQGITVAEMARKLGISESFYYKIEQGIRNPTMNLAKRIADLLGSTVDELFFESQLDETSNNMRLGRDEMAAAAESADG